VAGQASGLFPYKAGRVGMHRVALQSGLIYDEWVDGKLQWHLWVVAMGIDSCHF